MLRITYIKNLFNHKNLCKRNIVDYKYRHIGVNKNKYELLEKCNVETMEEFIEKVNPSMVKSNLPKLEKLNEYKAYDKLKNILNKNINVKSLIGMGYYNTILPNPIKRHILENPNWYTAYTPYQPEISQGRLESHYNYQEIIKSLTGLSISNASLLDEGSCASEVMNMCYNYYKCKRDVFIICDKMNPVIKDILELRAEILGIKLLIVNLKKLKIEDINSEKVFGIMTQYPNIEGEINLSFLEKIKDLDILKICSCDLMSLIKIKSPKELGFNVAFGNSQRFGIPMWYGGPHPAFLAVEKELLRLLPGRIIGKTVDSLNNEVYRLGLQTREQHIRREKATSNICTSQSLLTNVVSLYTIYNGKEGLKNISTEINNNTIKIGNNIKEEHLKYRNFYDTIVIKCKKSEKIYEDLENMGIIVRKINKTEIGITIDETVDTELIEQIIKVYNKYYKNEKENDLKLNSLYLRDDNFLNDDLYDKYTTETELLRYIKSLEKKDYTLCDGMIPLGSCTMKLNGVNQLQPLSWDSITNCHPYLPLKYVKGCQELIKDTGEMLKKITGFSHYSFQSNSGAMGEYSGLLCIRKYHLENNQSNRNICLIPKSAHGTNFASASISNYNIVKFDDNLFDDLNKFDNYVKDLKDDLGCLMITYPNTNGIFQNNIKEICNIIHKYGGLVYMDGANMNALVGLTNPNICGADVCHLNLHKTFCIPHGGGGPGMGPILCNDKLGKYLPTNNIQLKENKKSIGSISSSNWSSASLLTIPYMYILTMGNDLKDSTEIALLNSNYLKESLKLDYKIIDVNENGKVGHEFIIDVTDLKKYNITENDIAKRLMDYSFHPPTMSWPRSGVLMFEPTESESKEELDRLIESMISIKKEINYIIDNNLDLENNILKNAPHTFKMTENWNYNYSIKQAFYPLDSLYDRKYNVPIGRVNNLYGDKILLQK